MGISFPLKRRDQLLEYVLTLMGRDQSDDLVDFSIELLQTQLQTQVLTLIFVTIGRLNSSFQLNFIYLTQALYPTSIRPKFYSL
jgi:hypothetical protein